MQLSVRISGKSFTKKSKALIDSGANAFGANTSAITGSKKLCHSRELADVKNCEQALRNFVRTNTIRLGELTVISPKRYLKVKQEVTKLSDKFADAKTALLAAWDNVCKADQSKLGTLYNSADYPTANEIAQAFDVKVSVLPLPVANFAALGLPSEETETLATAFSETVAKDLQAMSCELFGKLVYGSNPDTNDGAGNGLLYAIKRLKSGDSFRSATLRNVSDIADTVNDLNALDNPDIAKLAESLKEVFAVDADAVRDNEVARANLVASAEEQLRAIESAMQGVC